MRRLFNLLFNLSVAGFAGVTGVYALSNGDGVWTAVFWGLAIANLGAAVMPSRN